jgi:hypothetical protein
MIMKKILELVCALVAVLFVTNCPSFAIEVKSTDGGIEIENSFYKAAVSPEGGAIRSLILKSTGENMVGSEGMAGDIETSGLNRPNLTADYRLNIIKQNHEEAQVSATIEGSGSFRETGVTYEKTYIFRENTPLIIVRVRITNHGSPKSFAYRVFNTVTPDGRCTGNTYFVEKNTGLETLEFPKASSNNFIKDVFTGWAGAFNPKNSSAILCKAASRAVDQYLVFLSEKIATIEWYYKRISLGTGSVFSTEYFILPVSNVTSAAASIIAAEKLTGNRILVTNLETSEHEHPAAGVTGNTVLVAGAFSTYNLSNAYIYKIVQSLEKVPDLKIDICQVVLENESKLYKGHFLKSFPTSKSGLAKYKAVIMIDIPAWALDNNAQDYITEYVKDGGTLVMVGDHARGYKGSKLAEFFPLNFDYSAEFEGWAGTIMNDKSGLLKPSVIDAGNSILRNINCSNMPNVVVHKSSPAKDTRIVMKAGDYSLIAERIFAKGRIISFPISMTEEARLVKTCWPDGFVSSNYWDDKITAWNFYDELWRNIVLYNEDPPSISLSKINIPDKEIISPANVAMSADIVNNASTLQSGKVVFTFVKDGQVLKQVSEAYILKPGVSRSTAFKVALQPMSGSYTWRMDIKDSAGKLVTWLDGNFTAHPVTWVKLDLPPLKVFGREGRVDLAATVTGLDKSGTCSIRTLLADSQGKVIQRLSPVAVGSAASSISQQVKLGNIKTGDYVVTCELFLGGRIVDIASENIYIAPKIDKENFYPNITYSSIGEDRNQALDIVRSAKEVGFNGIQIYNWHLYKSVNRWRYSFGNQCTAYEEAEKLGMVFNPCASSGKNSWNQWWEGSVLLKPSDFGKSEEEDALDYRKVFGESPRLFAAYIADEPSVNLNMWVKNETCKAAFKAKFGHELTNDKKNRNFYDSFKFLADGQVDVLKYGNSFFKKYNPETDVFACLNLFGSMFNTNINQVASALDYSGVDHYQYGVDAYALDLLWSASNFSDKMWLIPTSGLLYTGPYYPEYAGTQVYNALCHNAKGMAWWTWSYMDDDVKNDSAKIKCMKKAFAELTTLGPLFKHISRERSEMAMLFPWTSALLNSRDESLWKATHGLLSRTFGQADFLHEEQIRRGAFLSDYKVLVLAGARYIPEDVAQKIKEWTSSGGTLVVMPGAPEYNQYQEKSNTLSSIFSATYGAEVTASVEGGSGMPVRGVALNPAGAQVLLKYNDGSIAATSATYGNGRIVCFGFVPGDSAIITNAVQGAAVGRAVSSNSKVNVSYFPADGGFYIAAVNQVRKNTSTQISVQNVKSPCYAYDILTGKEIQCAIKDRVGVISLDMEPLWGRVIACLPTKPAKLYMTASKDKELVYNIKLTDAAGRLVNAKLPVQITVTDGEGHNRPEYGGVRILGGGQLTVKSRLADNDPSGKWQITVSEKISGKTMKADL